MRYEPDQVYHPEADSYLLLEAALEEVKCCDRVIEIGTGPGSSHAGFQKLLLS